MLDLVVIGSGPCALALVSRLACTNPDTSADFLFGFDSVTEPLRETQRRLAGLRGKGSSDGDGNGGDGHRRQPLDARRTKVFDSTGRWMGRWNDLFR